jgi:DNA-binding NtrC family response regulator
MPIEKIIVLEDDLVVRRSLEQQLRYKRYDVASATTIAEAQELLTKDNFDLMIVDVRLPDGNGIDLLKQLQARPAKPLIVMVSGFGTVDLAVECMSNGAFTFLTKPFSPEQLAVTLKKAEEHTQLVKVNQFLSHGEGRRDRLRIVGDEPRDGTVARVDSESGAHAGDGVDPGRERHGQRAGGARIVSAKSAQYGAVHQGELRGRARKT